MEGIKWGPSTPGDETITWSEKGWEALSQQSVSHPKVVIAQNSASKKAWIILDWGPIFKEIGNWNEEFYFDNLFSTLLSELSSFNNEPERIQYLIKFFNTILYGLCYEIKENPENTSELIILEACNSFNNLIDSNSIDHVNSIYTKIYKQLTWIDESSKFKTNIWNHLKSLIKTSFDKFFHNATNICKTNNGQFLG